MPFIDDKQDFLIDVLGGTSPGVRQGYKRPTEQEMLEARSIKPVQLINSVALEYGTTFRAIQQQLGGEEDIPLRFLDSFKDLNVSEDLEAIRLEAAIADPENADEFIYANSPEQVRGVQYDLELRRQSKQVLDQAPLHLEFPLGMFATIADPINLIVPVRIAKDAALGLNLTKNLSRGAGEGLVTSAIDEGVAQITGFGRSTEESLVNLGTGFAAGAFLSGPVAAYLGRKHAKFAQQMKRDMDVETHVNMNPEKYSEEIIPPRDGRGEVEVRITDNETGEVFSSKDSIDEVGAAKTRDVVEDPIGDANDIVRLTRRKARVFSSPAGIKFFMGSVRRGHLSNFETMRDFSNKIGYNALLTKQNIEGRGRLSALSELNTKADVAQTTQATLDAYRRFTKTDNLVGKTRQELAETFSLKNKEFVSFLGRVHSYVAGGAQESDPIIKQLGDDIAARLDKKISEVMPYLPDNMQHLSPRDLRRVFTTVLDSSAANEVGGSDKLKSILRNKIIKSGSQEYVVSASEQRELKRKLGRLYTEAKKSEIADVVKNFEDVTAAKIEEITDAATRKRIKSLFKEVEDVKADFRKRESALEDEVEKIKNFIASSDGHVTLASRLLTRTGNNKGLKISDALLSILDDIDDELGSFKVKDSSYISTEVFEHLDRVTAYRTRFGKDFNKKAMEEKLDLEAKQRIQSGEDEAVVNKELREAKKDFQAIHDLYIGRNSSVHPGINAIKSLIAGSMLGDVTASSLGELVTKAIQLGPKTFFTSTIDFAVFKIKNLADKVGKQEFKQALADVNMGMELTQAGVVRSQLEVSPVSGSQGSVSEAITKGAGKSLNFVTLQGAFLNFSQQYNFYTMSSYFGRQIKKYASGKALSEVEIGELAQLGIQKESWGAIAKQIEKFEEKGIFGSTYVRHHKWDDIYVDVNGRVLDSDVAQKILRESPADIRSLKEVWEQGIATKASQLTGKPERGQLSRFALDNPVGQLASQFESFIQVMNDNIVIPIAQKRGIKEFAAIPILLAGSFAGELLQDTLRGRELETGVDLYTRIIERSNLLGLYSPFFKNSAELAQGNWWMAKRSISAQLGGPWINWGSNVVDTGVAAVKKATGGTLNRREMRAIKSMIPFNNFFLLEPLWEMILGLEPKK